MGETDDKWIIQGRDDELRGRNGWVITLRLSHHGEGREYAHERCAQGVHFHSGRIPQLRWRHTGVEQLTKGNLKPWGQSHHKTRGTFGAMMRKAQLQQQRKHGRNNAAIPNP